MGQWRNVSESQRLRKLTDKALAERASVQARQDAIFAEVEVSIKQIYQEKYQSELEQAARKGESAIILHIGSDSDIEDSWVRGVQTMAVEKSLATFLRHEGFTVKPYSGGSHGDRDGLEVSWA